MALAFQNIVQATIPMVDISGSRSQVQINFRVGAIGDLASIIGVVVGGIPLIEALSRASATGLTLSLPYREDDVTPPQSDSRVERRGRWDLINTEGRRFFITIPAITPGVVNEQGYINRNDPRVVAFEQFLTVSTAADSRGIEIGGIVDAREIYRASTRTSRPRLRG